MENNWKEYKFSDFVNINPSVSLKANEEYSFVEMKDLEDGNKYCFPKIKKIKGGGAKFQNGDTLFARITPCLENGKICQVKGLENKLGFGSTEFYVFRGKEDISDTEFVYYLSRWNDVRDHAEINLDGTSGRQRVPKASFDDLHLLMPPLPEQKAIASVLSSLDDKIDLLHQQNQTLEALAETLFRQWFIEEAKEDWPIYKFKDIVKHVKPGTNFQPKRVNNGIPFLNVKNLNNGFIDLQNNTFISQEEYERVHKNWKPEVGDVLISRIGTLGLVATILERDLPIAVHYNMINLKPKLIGTEFLYFFLKSNHFQEEYFSRARQSVQEYLAIEDVEEIEVKLPLEFDDFELKEKQFIEFYNKIKNNFIQIQTLTQLRDTLLPKLMSGAVSLSNCGEVRVKN